MFLARYSVRLSTAKLDWMAGSRNKTLAGVPEWSIVENARISADLTGTVEGRMA